MCRIFKPLKFWATNFHAVVDAADCVGCGLCEDTCQVNAVSVSEKKQYATVDKNRCLGCGNCLSGCPTQAISLLKNPTETVPPKNREALFDIIKANQKGWFGTFMLAVQLVVDALRSGHTEILKPEKDIAPAQPACQPPTAETTDLGFKHEKGAQKKM